MTSLDPQFERRYRDVLMDQLEARVRALGETWRDVARDAFQSYATRNDYEIEHIWQQADGPTIDRTNDRVTATIRWPGLTALFEWGVDPHPITGNPLAFRWHAPPGGTRPKGAPAFVVAEEVDWGSVTGGIPEARAIREGRDHVQNSFRTGGP